jgi:cytoskeleton protein RodZ
VDLGTDLRKARERAGFSLPDLAARTRIPLKSLQAIEQNDFAKVPPGIFVRSFIRSYAREVGVDPVTAVAQFRAMTDPVDEPAQESKNEPAIDDRMEPGSYRPDFAESRPGWGYALIVAALLIGVISMNRDTAQDTSGKATAATAPGPSASSDAARPVATAGSGLQIELRAHGLCWIRADTDGQPALARLLQPGDTETLTAQRDIVLRVGDPAALSYSVNGRAGQPLGVANVAVTVRVRADGRISPVS